MNYDWVYLGIGGLIRQRRKQLKLTQEKLAPLVDLSRTSLANIESGRQKVLVHQLFAFSSALEMDPADLLPKQLRPIVGSDEVKFSKQLSTHQRAQLMQLLMEEPPMMPTERDTVAKYTKR
ncbi:helix-turn-helix transcriptional regulator [Rhizobium brockwellii]|uniref:Helix-turn-helix transcriptional regulator n=1 Tax=Rhizobium brockwellii TaxID=3019932 RepID=A0ABU3YLG4_9HYPH|nr:helix-turn-helix transcriptional regulator [Rhizobium brockwellii]MDV4179767.1 helix-turn-helix transcriptional regulator [Rhizobium brockwellii]MDV4186689.1 helix-turn-helix transcriptional regulator [Rhizobium brockwellii]